MSESGFRPGPSLLEPCLVPGWRLSKNPAEARVFPVIPATVDSGTFFLRGLSMRSRREVPAPGCSLPSSVSEGALVPLRFPRVFLRPRRWEAANLTASWRLFTTSVISPVTGREIVRIMSALRVFARAFRR